MGKLSNCHCYLVPYGNSLPSLLQGEGVITYPRPPFLVDYDVTVPHPSAVPLKPTSKMVQTQKIRPTARAYHSRFSTPNPRAHSALSRFISSSAHCFFLTHSARPHPAAFPAALALVPGRMPGGPPAANARAPLFSPSAAFRLLAHSRLCR